MDETTRELADLTAPTYFFPSDKLGEGEPELGSLLIRSAVKTMRDMEPAPAALVFINAGVKLCCEGSPVIEELRALEERGALLISCGTCLDYYQLKDKLRAGRISNMKEILGTLASTSRLVRL